MAHIVALDVKTISIETITPSSSTPSHLKTYKLSLVDQIYPPYHTMMLLFYPETLESPSRGVDVNILKTSLSKTLSKFYPFAGRIKDDFTVSCNDKGVVFIETRVNCVLSEYLSSSNKTDHMHKLTPPKEFKAEKPVSELVPLAFQVNVFSCGGVVLAGYKLHKLLLDGTSLVAFLKHWAAIASSYGGGDRGDIVHAIAAPDFDAVHSAFPPQPSLDWQPFDTNCPEHRAIVQQYQGVRVVTKSFVFTKEAINELRMIAACAEVPKPTRVEALTGFVWEHCMAAAYTTGDMPMGPDPSVMSLLVNMRPRFKPPLPSMSMGNLVTTVSARANGETRLSEMVKKIHAAVSNVSDAIESYQGGQNINALVTDLAPFTRYAPGMYGVSSWCQFGLDEIDFGFGKSKRASPTNGILSPLQRNFIYFTVDSKGDGIEVWLYLEEKEMQILESNKKFLAFACPS